MQKSRSKRQKDAARLESAWLNMSHVLKADRLLFKLNEIQQITKCHTWQTCFCGLTLSLGSLASSHHGRVAAASVAETSGYVAWNIAAGLWARSIGVPRLTIQGGNVYETTSKNWVAFCSREGWDCSYTHTSNIYCIHTIITYVYIFFNFMTLKSIFHICPVDLFKLGDGRNGFQVLGPLDSWIISWTCRPL